MPAESAMASPIISSGLLLIRVGSPSREIEQERASQFRLGAVGPGNGSPICASISGVTGAAMRAFYNSVEAPRFTGRGKNVLCATGGSAPLQPCDKGHY